MKIANWILYTPVFLCIELPVLIMTAVFSAGEQNPFTGFLDKELGDEEK